MPCALAHAWPKTRVATRDASAASARDARDATADDARDAANADDATTRRGAAVHREGAFLAAFDGAVVDVAAIGRDAGGGARAGDDRRGRAREGRTRRRVRLARGVGARRIGRATTRGRGLGRRGRTRGAR